MAGSPILDSGGKPMSLPSSPVRLGDGVIEAIQFAGGVSPYGRAGQYGGLMQRMFAPQLAYAAYLSSGMLQKVIELPAADRVREWRTWQAEKDQIEALEAEERRLDLRAKVKAAETLRGLGGGALILVTAGEHSQPLTPEQVKQNGLIAVNVVSRWQLTLQDIDRELTSPTYGQPRSFRINGETGGADIHPSRVVCFKGAPLVGGYGVSDDDAFWGQSRLVRVWREVEKSDCAQAWFAELVKKAKLLRIGIPNLTDFSTADAQGRLNRRMSAIAQSESILNAVVFDRGAGKDSSNPGEEITDYQVTWAGIPAMMDAFDQRVAAVSNIPFTVLMGRSPAGMNATGSHDRDNWNREVATGQELELRTCLDQIDVALIPSALGSKPDDVWWDFNPLATPTEAEEATRFKTTMEAVEKVQATGAVPEEAFAKALQNTLVGGGWLPGLEGALADIPEAERYGLSPDDDDTDPSAMQANSESEVIEPSAGAAPSNGSGGARRAANDAASWLADATPRPLYVQRKLLNASELIEWAKANGFETTLPASDMHVTVLYSRNEVDPMKMGRDWSENEKGQIVVRPGGPRVIEKLGENAIVLRFASPDLEWRHKHMIEAGGSHDHPEYAPHVTLTYGAPEGVDLDGLKPFAGELRFGPEEFSALDLDWKSKVSEE